MEKENHYSFQFFLVFFNQTGHSLHDCYYEIYCDFLQTEIIDVFIVADLVHELENKVEFSFEEFRLCLPDVRQSGKNVFSVFILVFFQKFQWTLEKWG